MSGDAMNAERLLDVYEQISEAPDAIARLRRFVLDLAVRGKLVEQDAANEPASALMKAAKATQAEEGIKLKADPLPPDETPFPAPQGWLWTRVGLIALQTGSGSTPRGGKSAYADEGTPFLRSQNIYDDGLRLDDVVFINDETNQKMKRTQVKAKDLLLNITGGSIGRCTRVPDKFAGANVSQHVAIIRTAATGTEDYLHLLVRSPFFQEFVVGEQTGAGRGGLPKNRMDRIPLPLPPLAEQHRIVAKVDELMALCDRLEEARRTREEVRDKLTAASLARLTAPDTMAEDFPAHAAFALEALPALTTRTDQIKTLRQTILNLAVRGKLGTNNQQENHSQLPEANHKVRRGVPETVPEPDTVRDWSLPNNWRKMSVAAMLRNGLLLDVKDGNHGANHPTTADYVADGPPFIAASHVRDHKINFDAAPKLSKVALEKIRIGQALTGDVIFTHKATIGRVAVTDRDCILTPQTTYYRVGSDLLLNIYLMHVLESELVGEQYADVVKQTTRDFLPIARQYNLFVPLPPLAEQHRIVARVDALMALCDRLEAALSTADTTRTRLLEALLHKALDPAADTLEAAE